MTPAEVVDVLAKCAAYDQRTVGSVDVMAWFDVIGDLDRDDALAAVTRHYRDTADRIMPAHVRQLARQIHADRRRVEQCHEVRALPGRFEDDITRDIRIRAGVAQCRDVLAAIHRRLEEVKADGSADSPSS
jgi:hypothetical protein